MSEGLVHVEACPSLSKLPLRMGDLICGSLGPPDSAPKRHLDQFSRFCTAHGRCPYTLQWVALSPEKLPLPMGASGPPSNTLFFGPSEPKTQMASQLFQPF